jgi:hypothetical protein
MLRQGKLEIAYSGVREFLYIYKYDIMLPRLIKRKYVCVYKICVYINAFCSYKYMFISCMVLFAS